MSQHSIIQNKITTNIIASLPISTDTRGWNIGVAGPICGLINNKIIVGGGANFPERLPWEGGKKIYHNRLYTLSKKLLGRYHWQKVDSNLPHTLGYSANVSTKEGLLIIGGENETGELKCVYLLKETKGEIKIVQLKDLPIPVTATSAVEINGKVYLIGGTSENKAIPTLFYLENIDEKSDWKKLADLPIALSNAVIVKQNDGSEDCIFVLGGRYKNNDDITTTFSSKVFKYHPSQNHWTEVGNLKTNLQNLQFAAGTGVAVKDGKILLFGGDDGITFNKIEQFNYDIQKAEGLYKAQLTNEKAQLLTNHIGFSKRILQYDVKTYHCEEIGLRKDLTQVTTTAFVFKNDIIIPSGEIKPGIRTPHIIKIKIQ
jgi:cyclically-permuted mutarotase family protein